MTAARSILVAHAHGRDQAQQWFERQSTDILPPADLMAWRAICFADAINAFEQNPEFMAHLGAWETGFDTATGNAPGTEKFER